MIQKKYTGESFYFLDEKESYCTVNYIYNNKVVHIGMRRTSSNIIVTHKELFWVVQYLKENTK